MAEAYKRASSDGTLPAHARQVMYAARGGIQSRTGRPLDDQYFCQTLLPDYLQEHLAETAGWDVVFDARGHLAEPHTDREVPLGTLDVRTYLHDIDHYEVEEPIFRVRGESDFLTCGPRNRFGAILFIEKEGFMQLFKKVRLAERYDLAIMTTKGMAVTACRQLVDELGGGPDGVPILVLHDFDKAGFSILGTLQRDTRRFEFTNAVNVVDLGLRLEDAEAYGLQPEQVGYGKSDPRPNLRENGATDEEIAFLRDRRDPHGFSGRRVELNAFSSGDLIAWIEKKLLANGVKKVMPDAEVLEAAYRRAIEIRVLQQCAEEAIDDARNRAEEAKLPRRLAAQVRKRLTSDPVVAWDRAIAELVAEPNPPKAKAPAPEGSRGGGATE